MSDLKDDWSKLIPQVITLSAEDYDAFVDHMLNPGEPTQSMRDGAEQLRKLYGNRTNKP